MSKIAFDVNAHKTSIWEGPFENLEAMKAALYVPEEAMADYIQWKQNMGLPADSTEILVSQNNALHIGRRQEVLKLQVQNYLEGGDPEKIPGLEFTLSPDLQKAFTDVVANKEGPVKIIAFEATRETSAFALQNKFHGTEIEYITAIPDAEDFKARSALITGTKAADLLHYRHGLFEDPRADIIIFNSYLPYRDLTEIRNTLNIVGMSGASHVICANTFLSNTQETELWMQRCRGGGTPATMLSLEELKIRMHQEGYILDSMWDNTSATYNVQATIPKKDKFEPIHLTFVHG